MLKKTTNQAIMKTKTALPIEHQEQVALVSWFRALFPTVEIAAIPNGGIRHKAVAIKLKAEGLLPGMPDLIIPEWFTFVELKRQKGGKLSRKQKVIVKYLKQVGYTVIVAKGCADAQAKLREVSQRFKKYTEHRQDCFFRAKELANLISDSDARDELLEALDALKQIKAM